jgi:hypothetical protein
MRGTKMPYEQSAVSMALNSETLVLKLFAMTWVLNASFGSVYASPGWCCGKEEQDLVQDGSNDA